MNIIAHSQTESTSHTAKTRKNAATAQLRELGLLDAATVAQVVTQGNQWVIPVYDPITGDLTPRRRVRTTKKKTFWTGDKSIPVNLISGPPGWQEAVQAANGVVYLAAGEKDYLAFIAAGVRNVLLLLNEIPNPDTLKPILTYVNARLVIYPHDCDEHGRMGAAKVRAVCTDLNIHFEAKNLFPDEPDSKKDLFDFWELHRDGDLVERLEVLPESDLPIIEQPDYTPRKKRGSSAVSDNLPDDIKASIDLRDVVRQFWGNPDRHKPRYDVYRSRWRDDGNNPSFTVYETRFKDYGGDGAHGDVFEFIQREQNCDFPAALEWTAHHLGGSFPDRLKPADKPRKRSKSHQQANTPAAVQNGVIRFDNDNIDADITVDVDYITQATLPDGDLMIKADMGTGKTELAKRLVRHADTMLAPSHRVALVSNMAERLSSDAATVESYEGLAAHDVRSISRLAITQNSLHKLIDPDTGKVREIDLLILDEISQQLPHIAGDTFTGGQSVAAQTALEMVITSAKRVIAMDAGLDRATQDWLKSLRPGIKTVVNTRQRQRGQMTLYEDRGSIVRKIRELALQKRGVVVVPTDSKEVAKQLERHFNDTGFNALAIHADNSGEKTIKNFTANINTRLGNHDIVIYSPTYGSGIDIQHPALAVCAVLTGVLSASECHQLINRVRNADETHIYIKQINRDLETDVTALYEKGLAAARGTGELCAFDKHGIATYTEPARKLHELLSRVDAARNHSLNHLRVHFLYLSQGKYSSIRFDDSDDKTTKEQLKTVRETMASERKTRVLVSEPVDRDTYHYAELSGKVTDDIRDGHLRWKIENAAGLDITATLYDMLHTSKQRTSLNLFADVLHTPLTELEGRDRLEASTDTLITKRRHHRARVLLIRDLIERIWGKTPNSEFEFDSDEIADKLETWLALHEDGLKTYFNRRSDSSQNPVSILRWLLGKVGLKLTSVQKMVNGVRFRVYGLDHDALSEWLALAKRCRERRITQNTESDNQQIPVLSNSIEEITEPITDLPDIPPDNAYRNQVMSSLELI